MGRKTMQDRPEEMTQEEQAAGGESSLPEEIERLKKELTAAKAEAEKNLAGWQRAQADFINYRRRSAQETTDAIRGAVCDLVRTLLPVLDDFERAEEAIPGDAQDAAWVKGLKIIGKNFRTTLEGQGLCRVKALGEPFNPEIHEAVMQAEGEEGTVVRELARGYTMNDRLLRPAAVAVGMGNGRKEAVENKEDE